jgi:Inositol polyphosphate kinase
VTFLSHFRSHTNTHTLSLSCLTQQIDVHDPIVCEKIVTTAIQRASKWMSLNSVSVARPMVGQVGGVSVHKRPLLTLEPDYVLKPVLTDHRGIREIAFYETLKSLGSGTTGGGGSGGGPGSGKNRKHHHGHPHSSLVRQTTMTSPSSASVSAALPIQKRLGEYLDTMAMALAMFCQDSLVLETEIAIRTARKQIRHENDLLRQVCRWTPTYYGVLGQYDPTAPFGIPDHSNANNNNCSSSDDAGGSGGDANVCDAMTTTHLLLQDLTVNFKRPCVMDLKMGTVTYEPDAPDEKRRREHGKYPEQAEFGFRIVGMRFYDPHHPDANSNGYRYCGKPYGRALKTIEEVSDAFRLFFGSSTVTTNDDPAAFATTATNQPVEEEGEEEAFAGSQGVANGGERSIPESPVVPPFQQSQQRPFQTKAVSNLLVNLRSIRRWFDNENDQLRFYASSFLVVYDADNPGSVSLKMIDFGHIRRAPGGDPGYSKGLQTLKAIWTELLEEEETRIQRPTLLSSSSSTPIAENSTAPSGGTT